MHFIRTSFPTLEPFNTRTTASSPLSFSNLLAFSGESTRAQNSSSRMLYDIGLSLSCDGGCDRRRSNKSINTSITHPSPTSSLHLLLNKHNPCSIPTTSVNSDTRLKAISSPAGRGIWEERCEMVDVCRAKRLTRAS